MALKPDSEDTRTRQRAQLEAAEQGALMREVDEAVRQDEVSTLIRDHGIKIGAGVLLLLAAFGGWLLWSDHKESGLEAKSEEFVTALDRLEAGQIKQADEQLAALAQNGDATGASARLTRAAIALRENRRDDAVKLLEEIAADSGAPQAYRDLATVRVVAVQFEQLQPQQVIDRLKPLATPGNAWFGSAGELVGMAYLAQGKEDLAGPLFASIAKDEQVPQTLRSRTRQLAGLLGYDAVGDVDKTLAEMGGETADLPPAAQ
ncbi:MAG TPA: tetratricopeptide repeat protein [Croceibacterium sp.]|nr:tetratricopeptide repeat protein [Croceibacterium sp.]